MTSKAIAHIAKLTLAEMYELWPKTEDGRLCARLLQRALHASLVSSSLGAACTPEKSSAEAGAAKAYARLITDFSDLGGDATEKKPGKATIAPLHRFTPDEKKP